MHMVAKNKLQTRVYDLSMLSQKGIGCAFIHIIVLSCKDNSIILAQTH